MSAKQKKLINGRGKVELGIRPEDVVILEEGTTGEGFDVDVYFKQSMGAEDVLNLRCGDGLIRSIVKPRLKISFGDKLRIGFERSGVHIFDFESKNALVQE